MFARESPSEGDQAMADGYSIKHRDEFETMEGSGESTWLLARKALGTDCFGYNLVEIAPGGQIPEHDESGSGQVELYAILEGEAVMRLGGGGHPAPPRPLPPVEPPPPPPLLHPAHAPGPALPLGVPPPGGAA